MRNNLLYGMALVAIFYFSNNQAAKAQQNPVNCQDWLVYYANILDNDVTDIYQLDISGSDAHMTLIATSEIEVHIAYNDANDLIYAIHKADGSYRTLDPNAESPAFSETNFIDADVSGVTAAAFSPEGELYIGDSDANKIYIVDLSDNSVSEFADAPVEGGDIEFDEAGNLYLASRDNGGELSLVGGEILGDVANVTGMALSFKVRKQKRVAVSFFGDGASNEGAFHEGLNAASVYDAPAVFVCENNLYGASTSFRRVSKIENVSDRADAYGMRKEIGDGMNVFDVYEKMSKAAEYARKGKGPTLLELKTFRLCGHSRRDPNNYMTDEEKKFWKEKDPIPACERWMKEAGVADDKEIEKIKSEVDDAVDAAVKFAQEAPEPKPEDTYNDLYITCEVPR